MKKLFKIIVGLLLLTPLIFISCQKESTFDNPQKSPLLKSSIQSENTEDFDYCGETTIVSLITNKTNIVIGSVTVGNDENNLYVTYETTDNWWIGLTRQYAGPEDLIPRYPNGYPKVGMFPYVQTYDPYVQNCTAVIPLESLDSCFEVALFAKVYKIENGVVITTDKSWGTSMSTSIVNGDCTGWHWEYCLEECTAPPPLGGCETAFADGGDLGQCFLSLQGYNFHRWGWTNGPIGVTTSTLEWEIWAGAGQCNHDHGILVGTLYVDYDGSTATVTYDMNPEYIMDETHLYVGNGIVPLNPHNNHPTVAPGQYGNQHSLSGATTDTYTIDGLSGEIYIIAHAVVCDLE